MKKNRFHILTLLILIPFVTKAQNDSSIVSEHTNDSNFIVHNNIPKSKFWGNSWQLSAAYNLSKTNEFDLNIGRTYGTVFSSGGGCIYSARSYGAGYGLTTKNGKTEQLLKAFWEYSFVYFPPLAYTLRAEYFYNITDHSHYLRPSVGLSLLHLDILYNYSFNLNNTPNDFKHGVTFRIKYFHKKKNWKRSQPKNC